MNANREEAVMLEFVKDVYLNLDAPLWAVLGAPVSLILGLHFANDKKVYIQGARVDSVVREARLAHNAPRSWLKSFLFVVCIAFCGFCLVYIAYPNFVASIIARLPL
jgi:hypothetical protein